MDANAPGPGNPWKDRGELEALTAVEKVAMEVGKRPDCYVLFFFRGDVDYSMLYRICHSFKWIYYK